MVKSSHLMFGVFGSHQVTVKRGSVSGSNDKGQVYADHLAMQWAIASCLGYEALLATSLPSINRIIGARRPLSPEPALQ